MSDLSKLLPVSLQRIGDVCVNAVSARELYGQLGLHSAHWAKWYRTNVEQNEFALEHQDWESLTPSVSERGRGNFAKDFILAIPFAKKLAMKAHTSEGERVRDYFLACEQVAQQSALNPANLTRLQLLTMAMESEQERLAMEAQVQILSPKAKALDRIATRAEGSLCLMESAKALQMRPKDFFAWLRENGWIYKRAGSKHWLGYQDRVKAGCLEHKVTTVSRSDGSEKIVEQVLVTPKGLATLSTLINAAPGALHVQRPSSPRSGGGVMQNPSEKFYTCIPGLSPEEHRTAFRSLSKALPMIFTGNAAAPRMIQAISFFEYLKDMDAYHRFFLPQVPAFASRFDDFLETTPEEGSEEDGVEKHQWISPTLALWFTRELCRTVPADLEAFFEHLNDPGFFRWLYAKGDADGVHILDALQEIVGHLDRFSLPNIQAHNMVPILMTAIWQQEVERLVAQYPGITEEVHAWKEAEADERQGGKWSFDLKPHHVEFEHALMEAHCWAKHGVSTTDYVFPTFFGFSLDKCRRVQE